MRPPAPPVPWLVELSSALNGIADAWSAGRIPNSRPVTTAAPSVKSRTDTSMPAGLTSAIGWDLEDCSTRTPHQAAARPAAPPARASRTLSVRSWRTTRHRPAPSAARMASSRRRPPARISSRLATFAHATSSTSATAPSRTSSGWREVRVIWSFIASVAAPIFSLLFGNCFSSRAAISFRSASAWLPLTPRFSRPTAEKLCDPRGPSFCGDMSSGIQSSVSFG